MKSLNEDLKTGQFKQIYLLYGEENYLKKQYKERFIQAILPKGDTMNYAYYEGKGVNIKEVIDLAETMPFFASRRLIVLENTGLFKSSGLELAEYIQELPETTYLIFIEEEIDKRSKLYNALKAKGHIVDLPFQDEVILKKWILSNVKKEGKQIADSTAVYFLNKVGTDMQNIQKELEKLFCYTLQKDVIDKGDVDSICVTQITNHIFEMIHAAAEQKQKQALDLYYELLALKEPPMRILFLLVKQYRTLFHVLHLQKKGYSKREIATKLSLHPFAVGKYMEQTRYFTLKRLHRLLEEGARLEEAVKTGMMKDTLAVELFLVTSSSADNKEEK